MKFLKYLLMFLIPFVLVTASVVIYFKIKGGLLNYGANNLPSFTIKDVVKFSRFSMEKAPSESLVGKITELNESVTYESRNATDSAAVNTTQAVQQGEKYVTNETGSFKINFENFAEIKVENSTVLDVIQTLPAALVFNLPQGQAMFSKLSSYPVTIRAGRMLVENEGVISVVHNKEDSEITISIIKGTAAIAYNNINFDTQFIKLTEGQVLIFDNNKRNSVVK